MCSQRGYRLKLLRDQGLPVKHIECAFNSLILSKLRYTICAWGGHLTLTQKGRINVLEEDVSLPLHYCLLRLRWHNADSYSLQCTKAFTLFSRPSKNTDITLGNGTSPWTAVTLNLGHYCHTFIVWFSLVIGFYVSVFYCFFSAFLVLNSSLFYQLCQWCSLWFSSIFSMYVCYTYMLQ